MDYPSKPQLSSVDDAWYRIPECQLVPYRRLVSNIDARCTSVRYRILQYHVLDVNDIDVISPLSQLFARLEAILLLNQKTNKRMCTNV